MIKRIKTLYRGKRITESDGKFVPQLRIRSGMLFTWVGIEFYPHSTEQYRTYNDWDDQKRNCGVKTKEKAATVLYDYLEHLRQLKIARKKIVHEVDPEVWVRLKDK